MAAPQCASEGARAAFGFSAETEAVRTFIRRRTFIGDSSGILTNQKSNSGSGRFSFVNGLLGTYPQYVVYISVDKPNKLIVS